MHFLAPCQCRTRRAGPNPPLAAETWALTRSLCYRDFSQHCALHCSQWHCGMKWKGVMCVEPSCKKSIFFFFFFFFARSRTLPALQSRGSQGECSIQPLPTSTRVPSAGSGHEWAHRQQHELRFPVSSSPAAWERLLWAELSLPLDQAVMCLTLPFGFPQDTAAASHGAFLGSGFDCTLCMEFIFGL